MSDQIKAIAAVIADPFAGRGLTPREEEICKLQAWGRSNKQISLELSIGIETVKTHSRTARGKLNLEPGVKFSTVLIQQIQAVLDRKGA